MSLLCRDCGACRRCDVCEPPTPAPTGEDSMEAVLGGITVIDGVPYMHDDIRQHRSFRVLREHAQWKRQAKDAAERIAALEDELANKSASLRYTVGESEARRHRIAALEAALAARTTERDEARAQLAERQDTLNECIENTERAIGFAVAQARTGGERTGRVQGLREAREMIDAELYPWGYLTSIPVDREMLGKVHKVLLAKLDAAASTPTPPPQEDR